MDAPTQPRCVAAHGLRFRNRRLASVPQSPASDARYDEVQYSGRIRPPDHCFATAKQSNIALGHLGGSLTILFRSWMTGSVDLERRRSRAVIDGIGELIDWL